MTGRASALASAAREHGVDVVLVSDLVDVRWLTGFTGSSALAALSVEGPGPGTLLTDFRYVEQVAEQVDPAWKVAQITRDLPGPAVEEQFDAIWSHDRTARIGFDDRAVSVHALDGLRDALGDRAELIAAGGLVAPLREIKDAGEAGRVRAAAQLADQALLQVLERGLAGRTETALALDLEITMRGLGAQELSFAPIVAAGAHGALPHAEPREVVIERGQLVTIDWGCRLDGYCSDCTRTFAAGPGVEDAAREVYELVLQAQEAALAAVVPGAAGRDVDAVARAIIDEAGHGERFGHGLGHGVGLEVHEGPRLSRRSESTLAAGMVVTVEPGIYVPGRFGVRIEDLVLVTADGHEVLNGLTKDLQEIG